MAKLVTVRIPEQWLQGLDWDKTAVVQEIIHLRLLEHFTIQPQLPYNAAQSTDLQVLAAPIRHWCNLARGGIVPCAM